MVKLPGIILLTVVHIAMMFSHCKLDITGYTWSKKIARVQPVVVIG